MKISAYILANKTQPAEPPVPVDPVSATITAGTFYAPYHEINAQDTSQTCDKTNAYTPGHIPDPDGVPIDWCASSDADFVSLKPDWTRGGVASPCTIHPTKGSFTLSVGSLTPGNYVFEIVHFIGTSADNWSTTHQPSTKVEVDPVKTRIIKSGTHGQIEAVLYPEQREYTDGSPTASRNYSTRTIEMRVRYGFTIASGDATKVFEWGAGTDINLNELWTGIKLYALSTDGTPSSFGAWTNARLYFKATLYTAR